MTPTSNQSHALQIRTLQSDSERNKLDKIKLYKTQFEDILRRHSFATRVEGVLPEQRERLKVVYSCIYDKLKMWSKWDAIDTFVQHESMKAVLRDLHRRLDAAMAPFIDFREADDERAKQSVKDVQELRKLAYLILKSTDELAKLVNMVNQKRRGDVEVIMKFVQLELMEPGLTRDEVAMYHEGLSHIYRKTRTLPPLATLNGQIVLNPHDLVGHGPGSMWNRKPVLLQPLPRALVQYKELRRKFEEEVLKWRELDHSRNNLVPTYGIIDLGCDLYLVSPWTKYGSLPDSNDASVDHLKHLTEIATGLDYLHSEGIIHGSLYMKNIFISENGKACIAYHGVTSFLETHGSGFVDMTETFDYRRSAPEITLDCQPLSMASDTWSFGMLALEFLTGVQPFHDIFPDIWILSHLEKLRTARCKISEQIDAAENLPIDMKKFLDDCWNLDSEQRASVDVLPRLKRVSKAQPLQGLMPTTRWDSRGNSLSVIDDEVTEFSGRSSPDNIASEATWASTRYTLSFDSLPSLRTSFNAQSIRMTGRISAQSSEPRAPGPSMIMTPSDQSPQRVVSQPSLQPSLSSAMQQGDKSMPVRQNTQSSTRALPPPTPPNLQPLIISPDSTFSPGRPDTSASGISRADQAFFSTSSGSGSMRPSTIDRYSQMKDRISFAFGSPELVEDRLALLEACSYVQDTRYRFLVATSPFRYNEEADIHCLQYQVFREVVLSLSKPDPVFLETYMPQLKFLCQRFINQRLCPEITEMPSDLLQYMIERSDLRVDSGPGAASENKSLKPNALAQALAFLQAEKHRAIDPTCDYLDHFMLEGSSLSVTDALNTHNAIVLWVQEYILSGIKLQDRCNTVIYFLDVVEWCKKTSNFATMFAIGEALHHPLITGLRTLWTLLNGNSHVNNQLQKMASDKYEARIKKTSVYLPCLPYHIQNVKSAAKIVQDGEVRFLGLEEINNLIGVIREKLASLPPPKVQEGTGSVVFVNSRLKPYKHGAEGHRNRLRKRHEELVAEETRPEARVEARKILESFKKGIFT